MPLTTSKRVSYNLFAQSVLLLIVYAAVALLTSVKFLENDPLASSLPYNHASAFGNVLLNLAIISGLLGGGVYVVTGERPDGKLAQERSLFYAFMLWSAFLVLAFLAGVLGILEGRHRLELPLLLDIVQVVLTLAFVLNIGLSVPRWTAVTLVWTAGMGLHMLCVVMGLLPTGDYLRDSGLAALALGLNLNVALTLAAVALGFWLMHRFSNITPGWTDSGLYTVSGLLALAGVMVTAAPLYVLDSGGFASALGKIGTGFVPLAYMLFAAHSYRALSDRNLNRTLSAHWYALALLLLLLGNGVLGTIQTISGIAQWTQGTRLTDLQVTLVSTAIVSVILGMINQSGAELRGQNRRITGLLPFWLVAFGVLSGALALAGAGIVQAYLERVLGVGYLETQIYLIPLYLFWIMGIFVSALGIAIYALGFWVRRPPDKSGF